MAAILLAAGESRRWGADNKLLALVDGQPMIRQTAEALLKSAVRPILVVTGHEPQAIEAVLAGLTLTFHHAADYASGLSASLRAGIDATPPEADAILVCLGDMPFVRPETFDALAGAYRGQAAIFPAYKGQRGNPVLLGASLFPDLVKLTGGQGARALLQSIPERVAELAVDDPGTLRDIDRPEALRDC